MPTATTTHYTPALQAAVDAALTTYPLEAPRIAKAADLVARDYVISPTATQPLWLVGPARWQVESTCPGTCDCPDHAFRRLPCKHIFAVWLARKMQQTPVRSLRFYATMGTVGGVATVYETGQAFFQADGAASPTQCSDREMLYDLVLGGRVDNLDASA